MGETARFLLRRAGGTYWLVDAAQRGVPYHAPLGMNESGAQIWQLSEQGLPPREIARRLTGAGEAVPEEALADVEAFLAQLRDWMGDGDDTETTKERREGE